MLTKHKPNFGLKMSEKQEINLSLNLGLNKKLSGYQSLINQGDVELEKEAIHDLRVISKKVRAEAVLIKSKRRRAELQSLAKQLASMLSAHRDADVMLDTLEEIIPSSKRDQFSKLIELMISDRRSVSIDHLKLVGLISKLRSRIKKLKTQKTVQHSGCKQIKRAAKKSYRDFCDLDRNHRETYHRWRKSVKCYLYLLKLNHNIKDGYMDAVKTLADLLGQLHDLHVLDEMVKERYSEFHQQLVPYLEKKESKLIGRVHKRGEAIYTKTDIPCSQNIIE